jgi:phosphohistidine phosphatase
MKNRTLILIRHAKSSWNDPTVDDHDRPLNERGQANAPEMGERLAALRVQPDGVFSSTALRAATTAQIFAKKIGFSQKKIQYDHDLYLASAGMIQDFIAQIDNSLNTVLIFSHNPGLTLLVSQVWSLPISNLPTSGVVTLNFRTSDWKNASFHLPTSATFDFPKNSTPPISFSDKK